MNIFFLSTTPIEAATMSCDRHCVKMILESCQMLSTGLRRQGYQGDDVYGATHRNHPSTLWVGDTRQNYQWLIQYCFALCEEYTHRYGKIHKSERILRRCAELIDIIPQGDLTIPPKCMKIEYRKGGENWKDVVSSYRNFYRLGKMYMNRGVGPRWLKDPTRKPSWFASI